MQSAAMSLQCSAGFGLVRVLDRVDGRFKVHPPLIDRILIDKRVLTSWSPGKSAVALDIKDKHLNELVAIFDMTWYASLSILNCNFLGAPGQKLVLFLKAKSPTLIKSSQSPGFSFSRRWRNRLTSLDNTAF